MAARFRRFWIPYFLLLAACNNTSVNTASATTLAFVTLPPTLTAGFPVSATVSAEDSHGNPVASFVGPISFSSSDPAAVLPQNLVFAASDGGSKSVSITFKTAGAQTITVHSGNLTSAAAQVTVNPGPAVSLAIQGPSSITPNTSFAIGLSAVDRSGNQATSYAGTVAFTSSDKDAVLPSNFVFNSLDNGNATIPGFALAAQGISSITAVDTTNSALTASLNSISVQGGPTVQLKLASSSSTWLAGAETLVVISATDAYGSVDTDYTGTLSWIAQGALSQPDPVVFTAADAGVKTVQGPVFCTLGTQSVALQDANMLQTNTLTLTVSPGHPTNITLTAASSEPVVVGQPTGYQITALDACNHGDPGVSGLLHFSATGGNAVVPTDQSCEADGTLSVYVTFEQAGEYTLTAASTAAPSVAASVAGINAHAVTALAGGGLLTGGLAYSCAVLDDANVKCWGDDVSDVGPSGNLGYGDANSRGDSATDMAANLPFVDLGSGVTASQVFAGRSHTCAVLGDGSAKCWGDGSSGQLGTGDPNNRGDSSLVGHAMGDALAPWQLPTGRTVSKMALGGYHTCALLDNGEVACLGYNASGQLGVGDANDRGLVPSDLGDQLTPVSFPAGRKATDISCGGYSSCAVLIDGTVACWGWNGYGQLGLGDTTDRGDSPTTSVASSSAVDLGTHRTAVQLASGYYHTCALLDDQNVKCWGRNDFGQLGQDSSDPTGSGASSGTMGDSLPEVSLAGPVSAVAASTYLSCALLVSGDVQCWGDNAEGEAGQEDAIAWGGDPANPIASMPPINLGTGRTAVKILAGDRHLCALLDNGQVRCWGWQQVSALGVDVSGTYSVGATAGSMGDAMVPTRLW